MRPDPRAGHGLEKPPIVLRIRIPVERGAAEIVFIDDVQIHVGVVPGLERGERGLEEMGLSGKQQRRPETWEVEEIRAMRLRARCRRHAGNGGAEQRRARRTLAATR